MHEVATAVSMGGALLLALVIPVPLEAQRCQTYSGPGHDEWHETRRQMDRFRQDVRELLERNGLVEPAASVHLERDSTRARPRVTFGRIEAPEAVLDRWKREVAAYFAEVPPSEWPSRIQLDAPPIPLWKDRSEQCDPAATNDAAIRARMQRIVQSHPFYETEAFLARPKVAGLLLYVNREGEVERIQGALPHRGLPLRPVPGEAGSSHEIRAGQPQRRPHRHLGEPEPHLFAGLGVSQKKGAGAKPTP